MTDHKHETDMHGGHGERHRDPIDSEIDVRRTIEIGLWLGGTTIAALVIGYLIYLGLSKWTTGADPEASPLMEASRSVLPPAPNLQTQPEKELAAMRAGERERLTSWGWTDKAAGYARMPIEAAIDLLAVPEPPPEAPAAATQAAAETPAGADPHAAPAAAAVADPAH